VNSNFQKHIGNWSEITGRLPEKRTKEFTALTDSLELNSSQWTSTANNKNSQKENRNSGIKKQKKKKL
jgi:hypothetical protein